MRLSHIWLLVLALLGGRAFAFPDMIRHGYINCNACHASVVGGGLLTEYGRSLSREILSQPSLGGFPSHEGDEKFAYGLVQTPDWLLLGSDVRLLQTFVESKQASKARFMIMQIDVDASAQATPWLRVFGSVGRVMPKTTDPVAKDYISSPRHGIEFLLTPTEADDRLTLRAGRFMPAYGIGFAEHTFVTRKWLDFQPGQERYAAELAWTNSRSSVIATAIGSRTEGNSSKRESGGVIQASTAVGEKAKVGLNYFSVKRNDGGDDYQRRIYGGFAQVGLNKDWYALFEVDRPQSATQKWGLVEILKVGYELRQGLQFFGAQEYGNLDSSQSNPKFDAYSLGTEWFPRPHWDLLAVYRRERDTGVSNDFQDVVWLIGHFYL